MQNLMNAGSLFSNCARKPACCVQLEFIRWRKPRWIPQARSKIFKLPNKRRPPPDEARERKDLKDKYATQIRTIWAHQRYLNYSSLYENLATETTVKYDQEIEQAIQENEKINAEIRARREEIMASEWAETEKYILAVKAQKEVIEEEQLKQTEQEILAQLERAKTAIKFEDLDDAIEKAMSSEVDYNFAIDKSGNIYRGRYSKGQNEPVDPSGDPSTPQSSEEPPREELQRKEASV